MAQFKNPDERALDLQAKISALQLENKNLRKKIENIEVVKNNASDKIEQFVEKWYEENKDLVDLGEIEICGRYKVDLIPDDMEKRIYAKMLKIVYAFLARGII